jgi:hypothetical protein
MFGSKCQYKYGLAWIIYNIKTKLKLALGIQSNAQVVGAKDDK